MKLKGQFKRIYSLPIVMTAVLFAVDIFFWFVEPICAIVLAVLLVLFILGIWLLVHRTRSIVMNELISFATEYGQIQRRLLRDLEIPYALLDENGKVVWTNVEFNNMIHSEREYRKSITGIFPSLTKDKLPSENGEDVVELSIDYELCNYVARLKKIPLTEMAENSDVIDADDYEGFLIAMFLFDETALRIALKELDDQSVCIALIYLDNYEEALVSVEEVRRSLLIALIDRKVNKYIGSLDGICRKLEKDKYLVILRKKAVTELQENRFDILEDVKTVNIGNEMAVTASIGVGMSGLTYAQNYEFARNAVDLALGRGGDQAVVKAASNISYYGGKSQQVEKSTRVKARVKAHALMEIISGKDEVFVMGHSRADVDSFGAAVGVYRIAKSMQKPVHIVLDEISSSVQPLVDLFRDSPEYEVDMIIRGVQAEEMIGNNSVLVVVDVNKPSITECPELIHKCKTVVVLDHHRQGTDTIENATLSYVEAYASSACEMISEILQYTGDNVKIRPEEADCMYSGIMIDTNNFMTKTGVRTFEAAAFLRRCGADVTRVRKLFRDDADEYRARADAVSQAEIYHKSFAISTCNAGNLKSPTVVGAQAANELLNIKGIKASFVLTDVNNTIYLSARSIDEVNVQVIMERMGGGGHMNIAACQLENISLEDAIETLKQTIDQMIAEGDLSE